ncbi:hypothetical protein [Streptomyces sp. 891-h]|uniref:hypothetical protein n=1 Tax=Streptomyces sp. 891-h TaxID=2720714 RepID=UPI001FAB237F|nr:hypothetical protein [Streptomyces sp. 891-h]UNZ21167.1 hypothetical protein HC362_32920 [Streptomyces sp. 891-h]
MSFAIRYTLTVDEEKPADRGLLAAVAAAVPLPGLAALPLTASNDVFGGALILDADITLTMSEGAVASSFDVVLTGVPGETIDLLRSKVASAPLTATFNLGYFDEPGTGSRPVMAGRVIRITSWVAEDGLSRVRLTGQEAGGYALRTTPAAVHQAASSTAGEFAERIVKEAGLTLADGSRLAASLEDHTVRDPSALAALRDLAATVPAAVVIRDRRVYLGPAVGADDPAPVPFDPELNLVSYGDAQGEDLVVVAPGEETPPVRTSMNLVVLGHPDLRAGQQVTLRNVEGAPAGPLRITRVVHRFSGRSGYVCEVQVAAARPGEPAEVADGVRSVADRLEVGAERERRARPAIDVGEITTYRARGHQVTLKYGQSPPSSQTAPSVSGAIGDETLVDKPVAAPFAFGPCGLMTPVYPGMRALLAHNRNLVNDAAVVGYLWPRTPGARAPEPRPGDHWLSLPTRLGADGMPTGPGVNDLTDASGGRVVQARGLRVSVGTPALPPVGNRPDPPADDSITIEHHTGAVISVDTAGTVTVSTKGNSIMLTNGAVKLSLEGTSVQVK